MLKTSHTAQEVQTFRIRDTLGKRHICPVCNESIHKNDYVLKVGSVAKYAHQDCAGTEGLVEKCDECFMIAGNCWCNL